MNKKTENNCSKLECIVRYLLAAVLAFFTANMFLQFFKMPPPPPEAGKFLGALNDAGYVFLAVKGVFIVVTFLLIIKRCVPFALTLLAPIVINILLYHVRYDLPGIIAGAIIAVLMLGLAWLHRCSYAALFCSKSCKCSCCSCDPCECGETNNKPK